MLTFDAMTVLLFLFELELGSGAPIPLHILVEKLETWPASYRPFAQA